MFPTGLYLRTGIMSRKQCFLVYSSIFSKNSLYQCFLVSPTSGNLPRLCFLVCCDFSKHDLLPSSVYFSKQEKEEQQTENVFKVLSRPKSINSFFSQEAQVKRQKARPKTAFPGNVIPKEPEHPKAHPRITSGKPRHPVRGKVRKYEQ